MKNKFTTPPHDNKFTAAQVAAQAHGARGAKRAAHGAPDLRGDAQGGPSSVAHDHCFDPLAVVQIHEKLGGGPVNKS